MIPSRGFGGMQAKDRTHRRSARAARRRVLWSAVGCVAGCVSAGVWRHAFVGCGSSPRLSKGGRKAINEAGFEVGERMSPEQALSSGCVFEGVVVLPF
eukprot:TRINITY_DN31439_c0_g1_i1.p1 TRINITY_DN31439_c0_g1~~TRINITY_DN31439_c0_g1_i1.p1  ORF type:complete len:110 (+),score=11.76 TRINITY_DN31439_c0_g1_i1:37-330(+)